MWWWPIIPGMFVLLILIMLLAVSRKYGAFYKAKHMVELAEGLAKIRGDALSHIGQEIDLAKVSPDDLPPCATITSTEIVLFYSIDREDAQYLHHISMSHRGSWFAPSAARIFLAYFHGLLQLESTPLGTTVSEGGRYHIEFRLNDAEQRAFADRRVEIPPPAALDDILNQCHLAAADLHFEKISISMNDSSSKFG